MFARVERRMQTGRLATALTGLVIALATAACGSSTANEAQDNDATGNFPARVTARFPTQQNLSENSNLVITVKNTGDRTMPNVAVTLTNPKDGNSAQALGTLLAAPAPGQPILAGRSRAVWIINQPPGPCGYTCQVGGDGGSSTTAYTNTWALGSLSPGASKVFDWHVTAVKSGAYTVAYKVVAGLSGSASATGSTTAGQIRTVIASKPRGAYVNSAGKAVYTN
jgi:hypothetical protein